MSGPTLEDEVEAALAEAYEAAFGKRPSDHWMKAIAMRVGTRGEVATLDEAGTSVGVTRERVRQVMARLLPKFNGKPVPHLREIAELLVEHSPVPEPIGRQFAKSGICRVTLTGEGFLNILKLLGTSPAQLVGTDLVAIDEWLVEESEVQVMRALAMASRHTSSYGMTTVEEIRQLLSTPANMLDATDIERVLKREPVVRWAGEWLWVEKEHDGLHSNRLVNTARSILSVNSPQTVASIHAGARRMWKFRQLDILPPIAAMKSFFEQSPYFVVEGDLVHPTELLDYHEILGTTTATMIDVLKASPYQVMDRQSLMEACADAGIPSGTSGVWTTYAEWMDRFGPNVWGLRGSSPNPAAVEEIRNAARSRANAAVAKPSRGRGDSLAFRFGPRRPCEPPGRSVECAPLSCRSGRRGTTPGDGGPVGWQPSRWRQQDVHQPQPALAGCPAARKEVRKSAGARSTGESRAIQGCRAKATATRLCSRVQGNDQAGRAAPWPRAKGRADVS